MVHVHGRRVQQQVAAAAGAPTEQCVVIAIDTGKAEAVALVADFTGEPLCAPVTFAMNRTGITGMVERVVTATADRHVKVVRCGVEASGYHLPLTPGLLPDAWTMVELNPAHVAMQRRVNGPRSVKTDLVDATAMFDLLVAGRGHVVRQADIAVASSTGGFVHRRCQP